MAMYVLLAIFSIAVVVFAANCMLFVVRRRGGVGGALKSKSYDREDIGLDEGMVGGGSGGKRKKPVAEAADWVWIGHETLERNAVNTTCSATLMPEADFNGNHGGVLGGGGFVGVGGSQPLLLTSGGFGGHEDSESASGVSSTSGGGGGVGGGSNRSSQISTYRGSECSIRITQNLLSDDNGNMLQDLDGARHPPPGLQSVRVSPGAVSGEKNSPALGGRMANNNRRSAVMEDPALPPVCLRRSATGGTGVAVQQSSSSSRGGRGAEVNLVEEVDSLVVSSPMPAVKVVGSSAASSLARSTMSREERLRVLEEAVASGSDVDWDYEELGMTYEELMEYFDNLKESSA